MGGIASNTGAAEMSEVLTAEQFRVKAMRDGISELMEQCTEEQLALLHRIHDNSPWKGLANCPDNKLADTYELLRRTVLKNGAAQ
jgi:hypothetical protein